MKKIFLFTLLSAISCIVSAQQRQNLDAVSYIAPQGWQQVQNDGGIQVSVTDSKTGGYAIAVITKTKLSGASVNENFNTDWNRLVKAAVQVNDEPVLQQPIPKNGWDVISGNANYIDGNSKGVATLLSATGGGQAVSVVLMTNTRQYQKELLDFINSLELAKIVSNTAGASIVGLWVDYMLETTGYNINGRPQYTAGYLRKEYSFNADGTYVFRNKQWLTKTKDILFIYESGTYEVQGNQLIITPKNGKSGFWGKTSTTKDWGKLVKTTDYKPEKTAYVFEIKYFSSSDSYSLGLSSDKPTQRDGGQFNRPDDPFIFHYSFRKLESLIDNPPGFSVFP
ncbi:MAG: hypothetical protein JST68_20310 [Bacteroidetes bacterium]|nr:hypothetical protein [Bacteroidota bacterium]